MTGLHVCGKKQESQFFFFFHLKMMQNYAESLKLCWVISDHMLLTKLIVHFDQFICVHLSAVHALNHPLCVLLVLVDFYIKKCCKNRMILRLNMQFLFIKINRSILFYHFWPSFVVGHFSRKVKSNTRLMIRYSPEIFYFCMPVLLLVQAKITIKTY